MKDIQFVNPKELESLEDYGTSLLTGMMSLRTLEAFHLEAFNKGILDEDEIETGKTIHWEIQRLLCLYKTQMQHVLDRTDINEEMIIEKLRTQMPDLKIPRKRKIIGTKKPRKPRKIKGEE